MRKLADEKETIHSCSKCGLCQSVCPIYKITGNDCTVSRGHFIMLKGFINGKLKMTKKLNRYLDICLKCGACSKFCPSSIDVVNIITLAKAEYFKQHKMEKFISLIQKKIIFGLIPDIFKHFRLEHKSKTFEKKVAFFGGCRSKLNGNKAVIKILNSCQIEVQCPNFDCCGTPFLSRGDLESYEEYKTNFIKKLDSVKNVVTTCASCEKAIKSYNYDVGIKNIFEYIRENNLKLKLKKPTKVTFHKPCNIDNWDDIKWILDNTENLQYVEMDGFDSCCGLNGISKFSDYKIMLKLFLNKHKNIKKTGAKIVLTSCLGCEAALKAFSFGQYKIKDFTDFLASEVVS